MYGYAEARTKDGRLVLIGNRQRVAHVNRAWGYYNQVSIVWVTEDYQEIARELLPLGKFNKDHKPKQTGIRRMFDAGSKRYV